MGLVVGAIEKMANSNLGTRFFKWAESSKGESFLNNSLPTLETFASVMMYTASTEIQPLDRRRKNLLHMQNWVPALIGMGIGTYLNRKVSKFGEHIIKYLDPRHVPNMHKVVNAVKVILPLATTCMLMRFITPTVVAFASGIVEEKRAELNKQHVDVKA